MARRRKEFPSPQGGSETGMRIRKCFSTKFVSIPSRRVGDRKPHTISKISQIGFHPLKAGRRQSADGTVSVTEVSFHPLKAGRRRGCGCKVASHSAISIPSRRVGDPIKTFMAIISNIISIPSRRVGDSVMPLWVKIALKNFHPLKAGRRLTSVFGLSAN